MKTVSVNTMILDLLDDADFLNTWQELQLLILESVPSDANREPSKEYIISSVKDVLELPKEAVSDFLSDIQPVLEHLHKTVHTIRNLTGNNVAIRDIIHEHEFNWVDDGIRHSHIELSVFN